MTVLEGRIADVSLSGITITIPYHPDCVSKEWDRVLVEIPDGRHLTQKQRKMARALVGYIGDACGYLTGREKDQLHQELKKQFAHTTDGEVPEDFSLATADVTTGRRYIDFLVAMCIEDSVPTKEPLVEYAQDIAGYVYRCLLHRRCAICGKRADLHHVDRVGMGRDRHDMCHIGMACLPLCRKHHGEAHQHGDAALMEQYHLEPVAIDERISEIYQLEWRGNHDR